MTDVLVHKHLIIRAEAVKPPMEIPYLTDWLHNFIDSINMKVLMGPYVTYHDIPGNRGITGAAALMQFDVYSCGAFDPEEICKKIQKDFDVVKIEYKFLDRETELRDIAGGRSIQKARIKDILIKETEEKEKLYKEKILLKSRNKDLTKVRS